MKKFLTACSILFLLCQWVFPTLGYGPPRLVLLSGSEPRVRYVSEIRITPKDDGVHVFYETTTLGTDWWRPWSSRDNSRNYFSVRYLPADGEVRLVEVLNSQSPTNMYIGDTAILPPPGSAPPHP